MGKPHKTKDDAKPQENDRTRTGYFAELSPLSEARIIGDNDMAADGSVVRVTLIKPGWSVNGRYYAKEVLGRAAGLFEGGQAYADHPSRTERQDRPERSVRDLVGYYENVRQESDGSLTADLHVVQDWMKPIVRAAVNENGNLAGLSINALGETRPGEVAGKRGMIVEDIIKHNSTDVVTTPAAGGKFEKLIASSGDTFTRDLLGAMSLAELKETLRDVRPDLVKAWQKEWKTPRDTKAANTARAELAEANRQIETLNKKIRTQKKAYEAKDKKIARLTRELLVDRLLNESKLPKTWKDDIRTQLVEAADVKAMNRIIERETRKAGDVPRPLRISGNGAGVSGARGVLPPRGSAITDAFDINPVLAEAKTYDEYVHIKNLTEA